MAHIHPTSIIEPGAQLSSTVRIGPFCHIGSQVVLHDNVEVFSHVSLHGKTEVGENVKIYPFAVIGCPPQILNYEGEFGRIVIGENTTIREYVTINPGTDIGRRETLIGNNCFIMIAAHVGHDCCIGNHVRLTNNAVLGGHVTVGDYAILGGMVAVHQFVRIGTQAMIGGMSGVENDVIPFGVVMGDRARLTGLNLVGLKRRGFSQESIQGLRQAYQQIFDPNDFGSSLAERVKDVAERFAGIAEVMRLVEFIQTDSHRNLCVPKVA